MSRIPLLVALAVFGSAGVARADVAPPSDYVDPCKSLEFGPTCQRCTSPEFKSPECHEGARTAGMLERCRGWSYMVYCPEGESVVEIAEAAPPTPTPTPVAGLSLLTPEAQPAAAPQPAAASQPAAEVAEPKPTAEGGRCTLSPDAGEGAGSPALALLLALAWGRRRRG